MKHRSCLVPALLVLLTACEELEEQIVVQPDGRLEVTLTLKGQAEDVVEGYPLPIGDVWQPLNSDTQDWLDAARGTRTKREPYQPADDTQFALSASFERVEDLPRYFAPAAHPYRSAYLERGTELQIRRGRDRTVYVFERTFEAQPAIARDFWERVLTTLPETLRDRIEKQDKPELSEPKLTYAECRLVADGVGAVYGEFGTRLAREALLGLYTLGDASLMLAEYERVAGDCGRAITAGIDIAQLATGLERWQAGDASGIGQLLDQIEQTGRDALRSHLRTGLDGAGLAPKSRNAVLEKLEWLLTANDHADDLADAKFTVRVQLPGRIINGNAQAVDDGIATWNFDGEELGRGRVTLSLVSVLE